MSIEFGVNLKSSTCLSKTPVLTPRFSARVGPTRVAAAMGLVLGLSLADGAMAPVHAACLLNGSTSTNVGTSGNDTLQCDDANDPSGGTVRGNEGADLITLSGTTATAQRIRGDAGVDDIQISEGSVTDDVFLGSTNVNSTNNSDTFTITDGGIGRDVRGDAGADTINLNGGTIGRNVRGYGGADVITLDGASVTANIQGDDGNDTIDLLSGSANQVRGGNNNDTITLDGATINGNIRGDGGADTIDLLSGSVSQVRGDGGNDEITVDGATVSGTLNGNGGSDTITLSSGSVNQLRGGGGDDMIDLLGGAVNQAFGNNGSDAITLDGAAVNSNLRGGNGDDTIDLLSGSVNQALGENDNDAITLDGATINTNIRGGNGNDAIDLLSGSVNQVFGDAGADVITLDGASATVNTNIRGDAGVDSITVKDGIVGGSVFLGLTNFTSSDSDTFTMTGGAITGDVLGDAGDDTITLSGGSVDNVDGKGGADVIKQDGATISNDIVGGEGADTLTVEDGTIGGDVFLGLTNFSSNQSDIFTMTGGAITGGVLGDAGDDTITLSGGSVDSVDGKGGADVILQDGATIASDIIGGAGVDDLTVSNGTVGGDVYLGETNLTTASSDTFTMTGGAITGDLFGDNGADMIAISGGAVGLGAGSTGSPNILGLGGDDMILWTGGEIGDDAVDSASKGIDGGDGSDTVLVSAADYDGTQTLDGGNDSSTADGFVDELTLSGVSATVDSGDLIRNWEKVTLDGASLAVKDGALTVGSGGGSGLFLINGAVFDAAGGFALTGNLINNGVLSSRNGKAGDVTSVSGDYSGSGVVEIDVDFSKDAADTLKISGDVKGGGSRIAVNDVSKGGATGNDVVVVEVSGSTKAGDFTLQNGDTITSGAQNYDFVLDGSQWIFTAASMTGEATLYSAASAILLDTARPSSLLQRSGVRMGLRGASKQRQSEQPPVQSQNALVFADRPEDRSGTWVRIFGEHLNEDLSGSEDVSLESTTGGLQVGVDLVVHSGSSGHWVMGVNGSVGVLGADTSSDGGDASVDSDVFGLGATATWYSADGAAYADFQADLGWIDSDFSSSANGALASSIDSTTYSLSGEVGRRFDIGGGSSLTPQGQLWLASIDTDAFTDSQGDAISFDTAEDVIGRLGLAYDYENADPDGPRRENLYLIGSVLHNFDGESSARVAGQELTVSGEETWGELVVGGLATLSETTQVFAEGAYRTAIGDGFGDDYGLSLSAGVRLSW